MAKSPMEKMQKKIKKGARSVEASLRDIVPGKPKTSGAKVAGVAGAAVAGLAGLAAAVHLLRRGPRNAATFRVRANAERGWDVVAEGADDPVATFRTKKRAVKAARETASGAAPSELIIHGQDGSVQATHSYG